MSTEKDRAREEYEKGGYTYKKVADKFGVSVNTVKSWAKRDKDEGNPWIKGNSKKVATKKEKLQPKKKVATKKKETKPTEKNEHDDLVEEVIKNNNLTDKQQLFCTHYIKCFNATKAYQKAYGVDYITANSHGYKLLSNVVIKEEIQKLKQHKMNRALLTEDDIFQKYMDIAFADVTDYTEFGTKEIVARNSLGEPIIEDGKEVTHPINYVNFKDSSDIDGTIVSEVSKGKNGVKVKLADKMTALKWLADRMDLLPTEAKERLAIEKSKLATDTGEADNQGVKDFINATTLSEEDMAELFEGDEDG